MGVKKSKHSSELEIFSQFNQDYNEKVEFVKISRLKLNSDRARLKFNPEDIKAMAQSVKVFGILQPLIVNKSNVVLIGSRRLEAAKFAGIDKVPVIVKDFSSFDNIEKEIVSDVHSKHLSVIERAFAFQRLMEIKDMSKYALANYLGLSHNLVCRTMAITKANKKTLKLIKDGKLSQKTAATVLYRLKDKSLQDYVISEIVKRKLNVVQAGNFVAQLNDPEILKKHMIKQIRSFKTSIKNYSLRMKKVKLEESQKKQIRKELDDIEGLLLKG